MELKHTRDRLQVHDSDLSESRFSDTRLVRSTFTNVNLKTSSFSDVNLSDIAFAENVSITAANLTGMTINGVLISDLFCAYERGDK